MSLRFEAVSEPADSLIDSIARLTPRSPFNSRAFIAAARSRGGRPWLLALASKEGFVGGAMALVSSQAWNRKLTIMTAPTLPEPQLFWDGLASLCRSERICTLHVDSYASEPSPAPTYASALPALLEQRQRFEYVLDLRRNEPAQCSGNHLRNAHRAVRAGLTVASSQSTDQVTAHLMSMQASMTRRRSRGESVALPDDGSFHRELIEQGAGLLFQAMSDSAVLASILVLRSEVGAYYHSAGTTAQGMRLGASPFLVIETARTLAEAGVETFNLGGADPAAQGLRRFKSGFGAREVALQSSSYSMISFFSRTLRRGAGAVRTAPMRALKAMGSGSFKSGR